MSGGLQSAAGAIGRSPSILTTQTGSPALPATGVFVFRDRQELYERINQRVEMMFEHGVIEEVRACYGNKSDRFTDDRPARDS